MKHAVCLSISVLSALAVSAHGQNSYLDETIFGDLATAGTFWQSNASGIYYDQSGVDKKVMINTQLPYDGNTFLTVKADHVPNDSFVGMAISSANTTAFPFLAFRSGPNVNSPRVMQWFDPGGSGSFVLWVNGNTAFRAHSDGDVDFGATVTADYFKLETSKYDWVWASRFDYSVGITGTNQRLYKVDLPNNVTVTSLYLVALDDNASSGVKASLYYVSYEEVAPPNFNAGFFDSSTLMASVTTVGSSVNIQAQATGSVTSPVVANANRAYYIVTDIANPNPFGSNPNLAFDGVRVEYRIDGF